MKTHQVQVTTTVTRLVSVQAKDENDAIRKVSAGKGKETDKQVQITQTAVATDDPL